MGRSTNRKPCKTRGCKRPVLYKGLCSSCYHRARRAQARVDRDLPADIVTLRCAIRGCNQQVGDEGICVPHLGALLRRHGKRGRLFDDTPEQRCAIRDCTRTPGAHGVCTSHGQSLGELAERLVEAKGKWQPQVSFASRAVQLDEIDLSDQRFAMRVDQGRIGDLAASVARLGLLQNVILWQRPRPA